MKMFLSIVCLFPLIFATVKSLKCPQCSGPNQQDCSATASECPADATRCVAIFAELAAGDVSLSSYRKTCGVESDCNIAGSMRFPQNAIARRNSTCCNSDSCTPPKPTLPKVCRILNGITCEACASYSEGRCILTETVACTGHQTICAKAMYKGEKPPEIGFPFFRKLPGCASKNLCSAVFPFGEAFLDVVCPNSDKP